MFPLVASDFAAELDNEIAAEENMPVVKHYKAREYSGMFEYRKEDEPLLIKNLILGTSFDMYVLNLVSRFVNFNSCFPIKLA